MEYLKSQLKINNKEYTVVGKVLLSHAKDSSWGVVESTKDISNLKEEDVLIVSQYPNDPNDAKDTEALFKKESLYITKMNNVEAALKEHYVYAHNIEYEDENIFVFSKMYFNELDITLEDFIVNSVGKNDVIQYLDWKDISELFLEIANGVENLRKVGVQHICLNPDRILIYHKKTSKRIKKQIRFAPQFSFFPNKKYLSSLNEDKKNELEEKDFVYMLALLMFYMLTGKRVWTGDEEGLQRRKTDFSPTVWKGDDGWKGIREDMNYPIEIETDLSHILKDKENREITTVEKFINKVESYLNRTTLRTYLNIRTSEVDVVDNIKNRLILLKLARELDNQEPHLITPDHITFQVSEAVELQELIEAQLIDETLKHQIAYKNLPITDEHLMEDDDGDIKGYIGKVKEISSVTRLDMVYCFAVIVAESITTEFDVNSALESLTKINKNLGKIFKKALYGADNLLEPRYTSCEKFFKDVIAFSKNTGPLDLSFSKVEDYVGEKHPENGYTLSNVKTVFSFLQLYRKKFLKGNNLELDLMSSNLYFKLDGSKNIKDIVHFRAIKPIYEKLDFTDSIQLKLTPTIFKNHQKNKSLGSVIDKTKAPTQQVYQVSTLWIYLQAGKLKSVGLDGLEPSWLSEILQVGIKANPKERWEDLDSMFNRINNRNKSWEEVYGENPNNVQDKKYFTGRGKYERPAEVAATTIALGNTQKKIRKNIIPIATVLLALIGFFVWNTFIRIHPIEFTECSGMEDEELLECQLENGLRGLEKLENAEDRIYYCKRLDVTGLIVPDTSRDAQKLVEKCLKWSSPVKAKTDEHIDYWMDWATRYDNEYGNNPAKFFATSSDKDLNNPCEEETGADIKECNLPDACKILKLHFSGDGCEEIDVSACSEKEDEFGIQKMHKEFCNE